MNRGRNLFLAWLSTLVIAAAFVIAALSFLTIGMEPATTARPTPLRILASVLETKLVRTADPDRANVGKGVNAPTQGASVADVNGQTDAQFGAFRHRKGTVNTMLLAGIMAVCLIILATGIPNIVATLRRARQ